MPNSNPNKINIQELTPGKTIFVSGKVKYSHITKHVAGKELQKANERRIASNGRPVEKAYTTITITEAQILPEQQGTLTKEEEFIQQKLYISKENAAAGKQIYDYAPISKSPFLPRVTQCDANNPNVCTEIKPEGELANGLQVIVVMRIYSTDSRGYNTNGVAMDGILLQEPVKYYSQDNFAQALANRGITMTPLPDGTVANNGAITAETNPTSDIPAPTGTPYSTNENTANMPVPPETVNNNAEPANNIATAMNPPTPANAPEATDDGLWMCVCGTHNPNTVNFCGTCGKTKAEAEQKPVGITFNATGN